MTTDMSWEQIVIKKHNLKNHPKVTEKEIRTCLVKHLATKFGAKRPILASEARYGMEQRRADIVMVDTHTHAFEIKSDFDTIQRLEGQLAEYVQTFDYVTVVTAPTHLDKVRAKIPERVGLLCCAEGHLRTVKKPRLNKGLSKYDLASSISRATLLDAIPGLRRSASVEDAREFAVKRLSSRKLRDLFLVELDNRFSKSSRRFFLETDTEIDVEDLFLLRRVERLFLKTDGPEGDKTNAP